MQLSLNDSSSCWVSQRGPTAQLLSRSSSIHRQPVRTASGVWEESYFFCEIFETLYFPEKQLENAAKKWKERIG